MDSATKPLACNKLAASGARWRELVEATPDAMARAFALVGPAAEIRDRIAELGKWVDDFCLTPPTGLSPEATAEYMRAIDEQVVRRLHQ